MGAIKKYLTALKRVTVTAFILMVAALLIIVIISVIHFPYDVDAPLTQQEIEVARKYYTEAYQKPVIENQERSEYETEYIRVAETAATAARIEEQVSEFVKRFKLSDRPVLEIGSGRGYLQDIAQNYTGLDISPSVARFYHKKFILGSATAMPFPDDSFDGVWSIWVFEHVPNPEQAFHEARRVTRDKGVLFLLPMWNCAPWAAEGYAVRPYSDFPLAGKLIKASIPLRSSLPFKVMTLVPNRIVRNVVARFGPTRLRYRRLSPNYEKYWVADSDAVNSIDSHEAMAWFLSRGDECMNCEDASVFLPLTSMPLIIRVHKPAK
ncbi:MAG TPA: class I SAM-dependent methyltransferase [Candidatus Binatia bacterium]|jgi:ubiquinone/menaquinone biosynthesis C-methylase UbiE